MTKISQYAKITTPDVDDLLVGTDVENNNATKNFSIKSVIDLITFPYLYEWIKSDQPLSLAKRKGDVLYSILDKYTGEEMTMSKVTGTPVVDGIIYFQLGSEYFKRNYTDINPMWFGAKGNGTDNDSAPLLAAINALSAKLTLKIKFNYNLGGASIVLPANVTLSFEGGSITNGSITLNNTTIAYENISSVLSNVVLTGTLTNDSLDVRLFGILPNNFLIDVTVIYNTKLVGLDVTLFFPKGNYYFTELHVTKNFFQIEGEESNDLEVRTVFHPFNTSQYYIIKIGGTKLALNNVAAPWAKNSSIMHIWFTTPSGFTGLNLPSDAPLTNINYRCSALILDKAQGGRYAINGHSLHNMPLLSIGNSYELYFDYIKMHGNHGKSDLPIIQVTNNYQQGGYISASVIHQLWTDIMVGPVFVMSGLAGMNEFMINNVYIEGTLEWEGETVTQATRFTRLTKNLPAFYSTVQNLVPMFYVGGVCSMTIGAMFINATDEEWKNSLDPVPTGWNTRSFFKLDTIASDIKIGSVSDGTYGQNMDLVGTASTAYRNTFNIASSSPEIAYYNNVQDNFDFISNTNNVSIVKLKPNYEYINDDFSFLLNAKFITNVGLSNFFGTPDEPLYDKFLKTRWDNYMISESGFYVEDSIIKIIGKVGIPTNAINIEYYDTNNTLLSTQNYTSSVIPNVVFKNEITLIKPVNYSYLKLVNKNTGYYLSIYSLTAGNTYLPISGGSLTGNLTLSAVPTSSIGSYDVLTRNTSTGVVEKKTSASFLGGVLTTGYVPVATGPNTLANGILQDNGTNVAIITNGLPFLNIANTTDFLNVGINATTSILNSNRGFDFITNNSTPVLKLRGTRALVNTATDNGVDSLQVGGRIEATQYKISALDTAPGASTGAGILGEIRYTADFIYVCIATNTWKRASLGTW